jgi:Skp family chaperone for outer membrane proteins
MVYGGILIALVLVVAPGRETQVPPLKVGFVDMTRLFNEYYRTKTVTDEFDAKWNKAQEELDKRGDQIKELQDRLQDRSDALSDTQKAELEAEIKEAVRAATAYGEKRTRELRREKQQLERDLLEELQEQIKDYGTRKGYSMVFNENLLLHGAQTFDLTDEILRQVNSQ